MKRVFSHLTICLFVLSLAFMAFSNYAQAAFNKDLLIDDVVFTDSGSMSAAQIDAFLNARNSCISPNSGFGAPDPIGYSPSGGFQYGGNVSAGTVIAHSAQVYGLNPEVLLVTLQKEQSLVTSTTCSTNTISKAMGYGCPDGGSSYSYSGLNLYTRSGVTYTDVSGICVNTAAKAGFTQQTIRATWLLKFSQERSLGHTNWAVIQGSWDNSDDLAACYSGYMTQGTFKRCPNGTADYYDGWATIDSTATHMDTGATASLYRYTPHFSGNQNFVSIFENWFGGTISASYYSCRDAVNVSGAPSGPRVVANGLGGANDNLSLTIANNTGSACIEVHTWLNGYQQWIKQTATNSPAFSPTAVKIISADTNGDNVDEFYKIDYCGNSGMVEVHGWYGSNQHWASHIATNRPCISSANAEVVVADTNGDNRDEFYFIEYRNNGSNRLEVHGWTANFQQWFAHIATNYGAIDPASAQVVTADTNGDNVDEFYLINYSNTASAMVEVHGWTANFQQWFSHIATNRGGVIHLDGSSNPIFDVITADTNGDGRDELMLVHYSGTGSGRVEIHGWTANFQQWVSHIATGAGQF